MARGGSTVTPSLEMTWLWLHCGHRNLPSGCSEARLELSAGDLRPEPEQPRRFSSFRSSVSACGDIVRC